MKEIKRNLSQNMVMIRVKCRNREQFEEFIRSEEYLKIINNLQTLCLEQGIRFDFETLPIEE